MTTSYVEKGSLEQEMLQETEPICAFWDLTVETKKAK